MAHGSWLVESDVCAGAWRLSRSRGEGARLRTNIMQSIMRDDSKYIVVVVPNYYKLLDYSHILHYYLISSTLTS